MFECYEDFVTFIADRLASLRIQKNISARDMSLSLGKAEGYINHIENKINMLSMESFYYICEYLKTTPKDFFDDGMEAPELLAELIDEGKKISARDMSLSLGLAEGYINHIENKSNMPSMKGLFYICEFLKITPRDFFDDETDAPELIAALIDECKQLDRLSLQGLLTFIQNTKR